MHLYDFLEKTVNGLGFDLADVEQSPRGRILRLFIDKPEKPGGVDVEDCVWVSNHVSRVLAVEGIDYGRLEISSPGLDRVLKRMQDFERFCGREVNVKVRLPMNGRRNFNGVLQKVEDGRIYLAIDTDEVALDIENIDKARLVPMFDHGKADRGV